MLRTLRPRHLLLGAAVLIAVGALPSSASAATVARCQSNVSLSAGVPLPVTGVFEGVTEVTTGPSCIIDLDNAPAGAVAVISVTGAGVVVGRVIVGSGGTNTIGDCGPAFGSCTATAGGIFSSARITCTVRGVIAVSTSMLCEVRA